MSGRLFLASALMSSLAFGTAAASLSCPPQAPLEWRIDNGQLEAVRVLAYMAGDTLNEEALPAGPPDREWRRDGMLYQSWVMNEGAPQTVYQVDCLYSGTQRYLRLDAAKVKRCLGRWRLRGEKLVQGSLAFECK
jgi:hypothetical protein